MDQSPEVEQALLKMGLNAEGVKIELEMLLGGASTPQRDIRQFADVILRFLNLGFLAGANGVDLPENVLKQPASGLPQDLERLTTGLYRICHRAGAFVREKKYEESTGVMIYTRVATSVMRDFVGAELTADLQRIMIDAYFGKPQH